MVQVDGAGSGGLVDPGFACWVGISGALGAREDTGLSAWQLAVMNLSSSSIIDCPVGSEKKRLA